MGNYVLTLGQERCPDGAEIAPHPWVEGTKVRWPETLKGLPADQRVGPRIRFRSKRREQYRRRLEAPDDLIVTAFLNTNPVFGTDRVSDQRAMLDFISEYGFPLHFGAPDELRKAMTESVEPLQIDSWFGTEEPLVAFKGDAVQKAGAALNDIDLIKLITMREHLHDVWDAHADGNPEEVLRAFSFLSHPIVTGCSPKMNFGRDGLVLTLPMTSLFGFMLMETALVVTGGAQVLRCEICRIIFVTGPGTGRRGTAKFCSNRCRVAAQRVRDDADRGT